MCLEHDLACIEAFRKSRIGARLDAAQPHQAQKGGICEPIFCRLGRISLAQESYLFLAQGLFERNEYARRPQVGIELRNLVFEDQMIPERVPREFVDHAVVLVPIALAVREDQVGLTQFFQFLELLLDSGAFIREKAVSKRPNNHVLARGIFQKQPCPAKSFLAPLGRRAKYHPIDMAATKFRQKAQDRASASNLDIVAMGSKAKDPEL